VKRYPPHPYHQGCRRHDLPGHVGRQARPRGTYPIAALGSDDAAERAAFISAQLLGLALCRYILRLEPLASLPAGDVVAAIAPSVQRYLTQAVAPAVTLR
jgi:hypothetical protein